MRRCSREEKIFIYLDLTGKILFKSLFQVLTFKYLKKQKLYLMI